MSVAGFEIPAEIAILGAVTGLTYGLLGVGLTLVYRSSRVINFAHGEMGALPAVIVPVLVLGHGVSYWLAVPTALVAAALAGGLTEFLVIRRLRKASRLIVLVATIGVAQILFVGNLLIPRRGALGSGTFPTPVDWQLRVGDFIFTAGHLVVLAVGPLVAIGVAVFLRRTRVGLASRAAADNREAAALTGVSVDMVSLAVWILAGLVAGLSAILIGPTRPLAAQSALGPSLMVRALAAGLIGGLVSFPRVFLAGIALGMVELVVLWNHPAGGAVELVFLAVIVMSMLVWRGLGRSHRADEGTSWSLAGAIRSLRPGVHRHPTVLVLRRAGLVAVVASAATLPLVLDSGQRVLMSSVLLFAVMGLSLVVLTGMAGQVSLGQFAFVGIGALVGSRLTGLGYPPWIALVYATAAAGLVAVLVGLPALRVRGLFLAVSTLAMAVAAQSWLFRQEWLLGTARTDASSAAQLPRFEWMGVDLGDERVYYWVCLAALVGSAALVHRLRRTGIGRAMMAVRDNEASAAALSVPPRRTKLYAFALSGMLAGFAGYLYGGLLVSFSPRIFGPEESLELVVMTVFGGVTTITGACLGALWVLGVPYLFGSEVGLLSSGVGVVLVLMVFPGGLAGAAFRLRDWIVGHATGAPVDDVRGEGAPAAAPARVRLEARAKLRPIALDASGSPVPALRADDVAVTYGGIVAVEGVSLHADRGEIVGLIGPNGAGKTTLFDVLGGQIAPDRGRVLLDDLDVTELRPEARARLGLGRSFQQARLFDEMPLADALKVALERQDRSELVPSALGLPPSRAAERQKSHRADELIELMGLAPFAHRNVAELSTGTRRIAELGCIIALGADVILLDEPMAGVAQREVEVFAPVLREVRDHLDATFVLIDHDLPMVTSLVDRLYVMASGRVIAEGSPEEAATDQEVVAAYLGSDDRAIVRSGAPGAVRGTTGTNQGTLLSGAGE